MPWSDAHFKSAIVLRLSVLELDPRCEMITIDPATGMIDKKILHHVIAEHGGTAGVYAAPTDCCRSQSAIFAP